MDKLRILMIAPTPFFADRGCHVRIYEEVKALQKQGCDVVICTYHNGRDMEGVRTERIVKVPWYSKLEAGPSWQKPFLDLLLLIKSFKVSRKFKPNIIHAHLHEGAFIGFFVSRLLKIPLLFDYQGSMTGEMVDHGFVREGGVLYNIFRALESWLDRRADIIVPSSGGAAEILESEFNIPKKKVIPVTDGVDTEIFHPDYQVSTLRKSLNIPSDKRVVLYLGLLNEYQGVDLLIEAIKGVLTRVPESHFLIMGYPDVEKYRNMAERLGIADNVTFTGKVDYGKAPEYLCLGDLAVSAKLSKTEANGKIYNYMAAGLPTVCFDTPVNREILAELGLYADFGSKESLVAAIVDALLNVEELEKLKIEVRKRAVEKLSWNKAGERLMELYREIPGRGEGNR